MAVFHVFLFCLFSLYPFLQIGNVLLQLTVFRFQPLDLAAAQKRTDTVRYGCRGVHCRTLHFLCVDFPFHLLQLFLRFLFLLQQVAYVLLQAALLLYQFLVVLRC